MSGKPVLIGPFTGGLNNVSQAGEAGDNQVVNLINLEVGLDSSLTSRPPIQTVTGSLLASTNTAGWKVMGIYRISNSEWYVIAQKWTGTDWSLGYMLSGDPTQFVQIKLLTGDANKVTGYAQVQDMAYFSVGVNATIQGFKWRKSDATLADFTITGAGIVKGDILIAYKSRLWIAGTGNAATGSRVMFSTIDSSGTPKLDTWTTATDFFDVAPGESGFITAMLPLNNSILIFKNDGTWRFSYPGSPSKGQQDKISGYIGAANQLCVVDFENYVYVYSQGRLYELINNIYNQINRTVRFNLDSGGIDGNASDVSLSIVTRRLVFRYYNAVYSYFIDTKTWSQWRSYAGTPGRFYQLPADNSSANQSIYVAASQGLTQSPSGNYITDPSFASTVSYIRTIANPGYSYALNGGIMTVTKVSGASAMSIFLNESGSTANYNIIASSGQKFNFNATTSMTGAGTAFFRMSFVLRDGTKVDVNSATFTTNGNVTIVAPDQAIKAYAILFATGMAVGDVFTISNPSVSRTSATSPFTLMTVSDIYQPSANTIEYMECLVRTKSYDYQAPSAYKRMFWWGADVKTNRTIDARAIPVAKQLPITWGQLAAYTHNQLSAGTWGNPLSFLNTSITVLDEADVSNSLTENGRLFIKILKSLRFRQISFELSMTTLGNSDTGPCKVFSITSYVLPKETAAIKVS